MKEIVDHFPLLHVGHGYEDSKVLSGSVYTNVWLLVRRLDESHKYKSFVSKCVVRRNWNLEIGSFKEVDVISGLPTTILND
ncbi:hypothetical protein VNO77_42466 [Canavalia gladiata]|uniref:Uncharacterized protein n=1 Tax=Canavalia gladiata TaxID=3824 RepID=A0AAN9JSX0_CANGL